MVISNEERKRGERITQKNSRERREARRTIKKEYEGDT